MLPIMGLGTFRMTNEQARAAVLSALDIGFRYIDTAQMYDNEQGVGEGVRESRVPRSDLFITTKVWHTHLGRDGVIASLRDSLHRLGLGEVDLTLIHWPSPGGQVPMAETIAALSEAQKIGLTRHIGVSNFTASLLDEALACEGGQEILTNQIEVHPFLRNTRLVDHCQSRGVTVTAYMPLATGRVLDSQVLTEIGARHGVSAAQVSLAWLIARKLSVIPASTDPAHQRADFAALRLELTAEEIAEIDGLDIGDRIANPNFAPDWNS